VSLELVDVTGRRVARRELPALGAGPHVQSLAGAATGLAPGVYFVRLTHASGSVTKRVALSR